MPGTTILSGNHLFETSVIANRKAVFPMHMGWSFFLFFACIIGLIALFGTIFWIWMIVDCATNEPSEGNGKVMWLVIIVLTHLIGAAMYYLVRRPERMQAVGR